MTGIRHRLRRLENRQRTPRTLVAFVPREWSEEKRRADLEAAAAPFRDGGSVETMVFPHDAQEMTAEFVDLGELFEWVAQEGCRLDGSAGA